MIIFFFTNFIIFYIKLQNLLIKLFKDYYYINKYAFIKTTKYQFRDFKNYFYNVYYSSSFSGIWYIGDFPFVGTNPNTFVLYFLTMFGKIGVLIFILISSYFMIESKFTLRKLLILVGEVYFYSFLFLAVGILFLSPENLTIPNIGASILPISHNGYWFITSYIILMLFSPFLNKFIKGISKNTLIKIILLSILLWYIFPTFIPPMTSYPSQTVYIGNNFQYSPLLIFFVIYLIGSYIRLYLDLDKISFNKLIGGFVISILILFIGTSFFGFLDLNSTAHLWWSYPSYGIIDNGLHHTFYLEINFLL